MRNNMKRIICTAVAAAFVFMMPQDVVKAGDSAADVTKKADQLVLTASVGDGKGAIGYSDSMDGGGSGPEAFVVADDGTVYLLQGVFRSLSQTV